jgi:putative transposase
MSPVSATGRRSPSGVHLMLTQYRHAVERGNGHLWQGRYYSCPIDPERLAVVSRYVELNPVRAGYIVE